MGNKREITYYDVSPYAALSAQGAADTAKVQEFSEIQKLFAENMAYRSIQTCEHNYTILDGSHREFEKDENIALWSKQQSLADTRLLPGGVTLTVTFGGLQSSQGVAFCFDPQNHGWCDMLRVKWHKDAALLSDEIFYPDSAVYSCNRKVELYNKVTVEFMRMNMPGRYLKIEAALFGIVRIFGDGELENVTVNEGLDPTGRTLYINSAHFTINTKDPAPYIFLKRQPLHITYNGMRVGSYYIDRSKKHADRRYSVEAVDKIGVLDATDEFMGGMYNNITAETLINQIVGGLFDAEIDESVRNVWVSGWLPIMRRREALAQVALATGAVIDATRENAIAVRPAPAAGDVQHIIGKDRAYRSGSVDIEFPCTGVELTEHNFAPGKAASEKELFKDTFAGEKTVRFSEPASNITVTGGTIVTSDANYAVIRSAGAAECVLSGRPYVDSQSTVSVKKDLAGEPEGTIERIEKIENGWLVNKHNSQAVARRLYEHYLRGSVFDGDFLTGGVEKIGDTVKIATAFDDGSVTGQIEKLTLQLGYKNIRAKGVIRGD